MEQLSSFKSVTYILAGMLLYQYNSLAGGWTSGLASIFGFSLYIIGLNMLKAGLDSKGKSAVSLMVVGGLIGGVSSLLDLIPMVGVLSGVGFIVSFALIAWGLFRLKGSSSLSQVGISGTKQIIIAMLVVIVGAFVSLMPFVGGIVASIFSLTAMVLTVTGWFKVQEGLIQPVYQQEMSY